MAGKSIEDRAVQEILKDTKRATARAVVLPPSAAFRKTGQGSTEINKRFLNNTVLSTVYNNSKGKKKPSGGRLTREDQALFKAAAKFQAKATVLEQPKKEAAVVLPVRKGKVVISTGSRFKAYLAAHKQKKEAAEKPATREEASQEGGGQGGACQEGGSQAREARPQPYWRVVEEAE